jgi:RHS repeat-associated protein
LCGPPAQLTDVSIPESGTTKFTYNSDGLTYQRSRAKANQANACPFSPYNSAKCITTTYTYDNIHRLTQVAYDDGVTPTASYAYDQTSVNSVSPQNPVGRLTSYSAGTASGMYSYDAMGRTVSDWQVPPSKSGTGNFLQSRTYDKAGNVKTFSDAVNTTFYLTYDSGGNLTQVTTPFADSTHPGTLFTANTSDYGRFGLGAYVAGGSINSGVKTVLSYTNFGELTSKSATDTGGTGTTRFSMGTMSYAPNGMLTGATVNSSAWSHAYDDMGRILTSQNSSTVTYGYQYDRYGNRWHQNVTAGTGNQVDMPTDNTTNKISTTGISQDALGNITNDGSHTYTFDAENRITQVDSGSTATYVYDAFNRRVKKTVGATAREFLFDAAGRPFVEVGNNGTSWVRTEIFIGGTHLATYSNGHTYFHHQNWLGSRATTTDETGAKVQDCEWYPFGDLKGCTTNSNLYAYTPYGYADYERDSETGLDHMQFRYYNSRIGRFMGADLLDGDISDPSTLNKFSYSLNDSVNRFDPLGLRDCLAPGGKVVPCPPPAPDQGDHAPTTPVTLDFSMMRVFMLITIAMWEDTHPKVKKSVEAPPPPSPPPAPSIDIQCKGKATFTAVGPNQATGNGALYSENGGPSIRGGTNGTVAVQSPRTFGMTKPQLRQFGNFTTVSPQNLSPLLAQTGGPQPPYTVSDIGDPNIRGTRGTAFDIYRFQSNGGAQEFGRRPGVETTITIPAVTGAKCPKGFVRVNP